MEIKKSLVNDDLNPLEFYLGQNYPNPAEKSTSIKYCVPYKSVVQIRIYNEDGDEIDLLLNEEKNPGTYEQTINTENYVSGNYFYLLSTDGFSKIKKMKVLKNK
jgi:hypothetical protein